MYKVESSYSVGVDQLESILNPPPHNPSGHRWELGHGCLFSREQQWPKAPGEASRLRQRRLRQDPFDMRTQAGEATVPASAAVYFP